MLFSSYCFYFRSQDTTTKYFWSTSPSVNELFSSNLRPSLIKSAEIDENRDGKNERIEINVEVPLLSSESIRSIEALVFHETILHDKARYQFDSVSHIKISNSDSIASAVSDGRLLFIQTWPLYARGGYQTPYASDPLLDLSPAALTVPLSSSEIDFSSILNNYFSRNCNLL